MANSLNNLFNTTEATEYSVLAYNEIDNIETFGFQTAHILAFYRMKAGL